MTQHLVYLTITALGITAIITYFRNSKKKKKKFKPWYIIIPFFTVFLTYLLHNVYNSHYVRKQYCGTVISKEEPTVTTTHRKRGRVVYNTYRFVVVKFDTGKTLAINLSPTSYYTTDVGKRICVTLNNAEYYNSECKEPSTSDAVSFTVFMLILIVSGIGTLIVVIHKSLDIQPSYYE